MFLKILLLTIAVLAIAFAGFAIKMFFKKDGEFKKQCTSVDTESGDKLDCSCKGQPKDSSCNNDKKESKLLSQLDKISFD